MAYSGGNSDPRQVEARKKYYQNNKADYLERNTRKAAVMGKFLNELKSVPCMDCGVRYPPYVMDFDHRVPADKLFSLSDLRRHGSWPKLFIEVDKCDIVCSNCHRERTHGQAP